jgi:hypothetical protein
MKARRWASSPLKGGLFGECAGWYNLRLEGVVQQLNQRRKNHLCGPSHFEMSDRRGPSLGGRRWAGFLCNALIWRGMYS